MSTDLVVTVADVERTRRILQEQEAWNVVVGEAYRARCAAGLFASWADGHDWLCAQPKLPPGQLERLEFDLRERRATGVRPVPRSLAMPKPRPKKNRMPPVIAPDRQLEIAIAAVAAIEARETAAMARNGAAA